MRALGRNVREEARAEAADVDELAAGRVAGEHDCGGVEVDADAVGDVPRQAEDERLGAHRAEVVLDAHLVVVALVGPGSCFGRGLGMGLGTGLGLGLGVELGLGLG